MVRTRLISLSSRTRVTPDLGYIICRWRGSGEASSTSPRRTSASTAFFEPSNVFWLDLERGEESRGGLRRHRVLEWTKGGRSCDDGETTSGGGAAPYVAFFHANSVGPGPWAPVARRLLLADGPGVATCVAVESRGHGVTQVEPGDIADPYRWELFADDFLRVLAALAARHGGPPRAVVTHSFAGDCALLALARETPPATAPPLRLVLLDPVLADAEGARRGADRLARGTRRLGEREAACPAFGATAASVGAGYARALVDGGLLHDPGGRLDAEALAAFARFAVAPDADGTTAGGAPTAWRLQCRRDVEASVYRHRVALGDALAAGDRRVAADVRLVFAERRRGRREAQGAAFERDRREAERVLARCGPGSELRLLRGVGHFLTLENPALVAETLTGLLTDVPPAAAPPVPPT